MLKRCKYVQFSLQPIMSVIHRYSVIYLIKSHWMSRLIQSIPMVLMTQKQCRQVIADRQGHAVIPPRKNAKPWKDTKSSSLERNELLRTIKRLGRTLWKKWSGYHRRSLVETKMHCIKLLGDKLSARSFDSQVNEIHARVAVLNRFTELGRPLTQVTP
eukprot:Unigene436_Nuclearia_a/m.1440 Unigene436_Nuclearia_a/g.1440  ORF Unigene436_Nuclearia_a/g.1440 Unigene436_Nuclearia_a/m.1440 type:complete len:158 (+) Unigene436_Nuclearia_a:540-1013(+)